MKTRPNQKDMHQYLLEEFSSPLLCLQSSDQANKVKMSHAVERWITTEIKKAREYGLPKGVEDIHKWYSRVCREVKDESRPLFEHIADSCSANQLALYICMEGEVDGRFDDIVSTSAIGLAPAPKMVLANNYWDEMGCGDLKLMHTSLFNESAEHFKNILRENNLEAMIQPSDVALRNGDILMALANNRRHSAKLIGALTILEHTAPYRFSSTVKSMQRHGVPDDVIYYHQMHIEIDAKHGRELLHEVVFPLIVEGGKEIMDEICLGLLIRKNISFEYYRELAVLMKKVEMTEAA